MKSPVYGVIAVPLDKIRANAYNPNRVAPPEMKLLEISIWEDGYTMPVVCYYDQEEDIYEIVDGYHRYTTMRKSKRIRDREEGLLPVVVIDKPLSNRIASTIRHNRARGVHSVELMKDVVGQLVSAGMSDDWILRHIGMDADELLRLKQVTGLAALFADREFSRAWVKEPEEIGWYEDGGEKPELPPLRPAGEPKSKQIVTVSATIKRLMVAMPEYEEDFRLLMKQMGFRWAKLYWMRDLGVTTGKPEDRQAETAHRLIEAGYVVNLQDAGARAKALEATFDPEHWRWVTLRVAGEHAGKLALTWAREDDLYETLRTIPRARWDGKALIVPPSSGDEVRDAADLYGFRWSEGAVEALRKYEEKFESGVIVVPAAKKSMATGAGKARGRLVVPEVVKIDAGLMDDGV